MGKAQRAHLSIGWARALVGTLSLCPPYAKFLPSLWSAEARQAKRGDQGAECVRGHPRHWLAAPLGELGEIRLGRMLDAAKNRGVLKQYLRNINVRWFGFDLSDLRSMRIPREESEELSVRDGDLFVCEGGEPGRCAVWSNGDNDLVYQKALHRVRPEDGLVAEFLMYQLRHHADSGALSTAFTGTTIKHLTRQSLSSYELGIAPTPEQKRIADKLDAVLARVDTCRERLDRVPDILKRFRQAVLAAASSGKLTEDWRVATSDKVSEWKSATVDEIIEGIEAGVNVACEERPPNEGERGLVKISAVTWGTYDDNESKTLPVGKDVPETTRIQVGDFLRRLAPFLS